MTLPLRSETSHYRKPSTGSLRLPTLNETIWEKGVGVVPGCKSARQVRTLRYLMPQQYAAMRRTLSRDPKVLAAFTMEMQQAGDQLPDQPGNLTQHIRLASIESAEQATALAEFHADPSLRNLRALHREVLTEIGQLFLLAAELKVNIDLEEAKS